MHITIQTISIWTKHQSTIIKPKTKPINEFKNIWDKWSHLAMALISRKHTTRLHKC